MKLLLFSDLHRDTEAARRLAERSAAVDAVVGAGDFATVHRGLERVIDVLRTISCPVVLVPGNSETTAELADACRDWSMAHVLHGTATTISGVSFFGLGGGIPITPFGSWSFDFSEEQAADLLATCPRDGVLVSHSPPQGAVDISSRGERLGSSAIRAAIEDRELRLVVCGHIHESAGQQGIIHRTPIVNAGPRGVEWDL